jgi:hypothetical protein
MRVLIATARQSSKTFAKTVRGLLEAMVLTSRDEVDIVGPLYRSGVRYKTEGKGRETFLSPVLVKARGYGDCAHLALWRVCELRNASVAATFDIWIQEGSGTRRTFHVRVRLPDGSIEDPSVTLGMKVPEGLVMPQ